MGRYQYGNGCSNEYRGKLAEHAVLIISILLPRALVLVHAGSPARDADGRRNACGKKDSSKVVVGYERLTNSLVQPLQTQLGREVKLLLSLLSLGHNEIEKRKSIQ